MSTQETRMVEEAVHQHSFNDYSCSSVEIEEAKTVATFAKRLAEENMDQKTMVDLLKEVDHVLYPPNPVTELVDRLNVKVVESEKAVWLLGAQLETLRQENKKSIEDTVAECTALKKSGEDHNTIIRNHGNLLTDLYAKLDTQPSNIICAVSLLVLLVVLLCGVTHQSANSSALRMMQPLSAEIQAIKAMIPTTNDVQANMAPPIEPLPSNHQCAPDMFGAVECVDNEIYNSPIIAQLVISSAISSIRTKYNNEYASLVKAINVLSNDKDADLVKAMASLVQKKQIIVWMAQRMFGLEDELKRDNSRIEYPVLVSAQYGLELSAIGVHYLHDALTVHNINVKLATIQGNVYVVFTYGYSATAATVA